MKLEHMTDFEENKNRMLYKTPDTLLEVASYRIEHPLQNILRFKIVQDLQDQIIYYLKLMLLISLSFHRPIVLM